MVLGDAADVEIEKDGEKKMVPNERNFWVQKGGFDGAVVTSDEQHLRELDLSSNVFIPWPVDSELNLLTLSKQQVAKRLTRPAPPMPEPFGWRQQLVAGSRDASARPEPRISSQTPAGGKTLESWSGPHFHEFFSGGGERGARLSREMYGVHRWNVTLNEKDASLLAKDSGLWSLDFPHPDDAPPGREKAPAARLSAPH